MDYHACTICPHRCGIDRYRAPAGYCRSGTHCAVASVYVHKGEEPVISGGQGICNVFFTHCNMQCIYCQNHEISRNNGDFSAQEMTVEEVVAAILPLLPESNGRVGFVSASHHVPRVIEIVDGLRCAGANPVFVYNSNGYDNPDMLRRLEGKIDIYLPDFKYSDARLAQRLSGVADYPTVALRAIGEMYRQKGSTLPVDAANGLAESGLIIRHLVLPGFVEQSIKALRMIAENISLAVHISLMSQYYPPFDIPTFPSLNRTLSREEYERVQEAFDELGFYRGWMQELDSAQHYRPDFARNTFA